jgi:NAD(P)-dependent dehydrogenase (short-subunit alcohol dehydrogenase family)
MAPVVLITGASSGIGRACARHLAARGRRVYGAGRRFRNESVDGFVCLGADVDQDDSVRDLISAVFQREQRLDVVVNCAGYGIAGSIEDTSIAEAKAQFETNFFGSVRVCQAALPRMREQGGGLIINVSSIGGIIALPYQAFYSATKFAIEGFTESLRMEVRPFGIRVVLVEPGDYQTAFSQSRRTTTRAATNDAYKTRFKRALAIMAEDEHNGNPAAEIGRLIDGLIDQQNPRLRHVVGPIGQRTIPALKAFIPDSLSEHLITRHFKVS